MVAFNFHNEIQTETGVRLTPVHLIRAIDLDVVRPPLSPKNIS